MTDPALAWLDHAITIAAICHSGQRDRGGQPYILHPLAVMAKAREPIEQIVAVLHDVIEDTPLTLQVLNRLGCPPRALAAIDAITRRTGERYFDYIYRCRLDFIAAHVKKLDIEHNLSPERHGALPPGEQRGLGERYRRAYAILDGAIA